MLALIMAPGAIMLCSTSSSFVIVAGRAMQHPFRHGRSDCEDNRRVARCRIATNETGGTVAATSNWH